MKKPSDLRAYFETIATGLGLSFVYGASERILNRQSSNLQYPVLWLEKPTLRHFRSGGYKTIFESAFIVLIGCQPDDYDQIDAAQDTAWKWTNKVLQRLTAGADALPAEFEFDPGNTSSDVIEAWSADCDTGWRTEFQLIGEGCEFDDCCDDEVWGEAAVPDIWGDPTPETEWGKEGM